MRRGNFEVALLPLLLVLAGCGENGDGDGETAGANGGSAGLAGSEPVGSAGGSAGSAGQAGADSCPSLITETDAEGRLRVAVNDAQNYSFQAQLTVQSTTVKSGSELTFDWSRVTRDMRGRELDPLSGVDMLEVIIWQNITEAELQRDMSSESIDLIHLLVPALVETGNAITSASLFDLKGPGGIELTREELLGYTDPESYPPESHVYSVLLAEGLALGFGNLLIHFVRFDPDETNTEITITDDSTRLDYQVDLRSVEKIGLPAGASDIVVNWSDDTLLTTNAIGKEFQPTGITGIMIGHYPDMTLEQIETGFLDIDRIAETLWTKTMDAGTRVTLSELVDEAGEPFTGIDDRGTWLLGLICGSCMSPAPWFLGVLEACPE